MRDFANIKKIEQINSEAKVKNISSIGISNFKRYILFSMHMKPVTLAHKLLLSVAHRQIHTSYESSPSTSNKNQI